MSLLHDIRFAFRILARSPGIVGVAVLSLALGVGANTAVFSLINQTLLKTLPVEEPERLVLFNWTSKDASLVRSIDGWLNRTDEGLLTSSSFPIPVYDEFQKQQLVFSQLFAFTGTGRLNVAIRGEAELQSGQIVTGNTFEGLGVSAHRGRLIGPADDRIDAPPVVVLAHDYWVSRFGEDPEVLGTSIRINGNLFSVIGVSEPGFQGTLQVGESPALFLPLSSQPLVQPRRNWLSDKDLWWIQIMGRLKPDRSRQQAQAQMNSMMEQVAHGLWKEELRPGQDVSREIPRIDLASGGQGLREVRNRLAEPTQVALVICSLILLIACANIANLLLARTAARRQELAVRRSLGASRRRLLRQLLTEALLISGLGGLIGLLLASLSGPLMISLLPWLPVRNLDLELNLDWRVFAFALTISLATGLVFGLAPAWSSARVDLNSLRGGRVGSHGRERASLTRGLVVVQVAFSVGLLISAGLLIQTLLNLTRVDPGFNPDRVLVFRIDPTLNGYQEEGLMQLYRAVRAGLENLPQVASATVLPFVPLSGLGSWNGISFPEGSTSDDPSPSVLTVRVARNYFETLQVPILAGRDFAPSDRAGAPRVAIVNEEFARSFLGNDPGPVGRRFRFDEEGDDIEIIGLVPSLRQISLRHAPQAAVYVPMLQNASNRSMSFLVRTRTDPAAAVEAVRSVVRSIDPNIPLFEVMTLEEQIAENTRQERQFAVLATIFAFLGLGLACVGLYGVLSHSVNLRLREIGIRIALGARPADILRMVMLSLWLVLVGIGIGLAVAWGASSYLESILFGLEATDPLPIVLAVLLMLLVASIAAYLPARRAAGTSPLEALRHD